MKTVDAVCDCVKQMNLCVPSPPPPRTNVQLEGREGGGSEAGWVSWREHPCRRGWGGAAASSERLVCPGSRGPPDSLQPLAPSVPLGEREKTLRLARKICDFKMEPVSRRQVCRK